MVTPMGIWVLLGLLAFLVLLVIYDITQKSRAIVRNFPVIGHLRYILEAFGPELRQYIVANNDEERPFSRDQRRWVYASSKKQNNYFGFGTDNDMEGSSNYLVIKNAVFPKTGKGIGDAYGVPCAKILGGARGRAKAFRPESVVNISGMSWGSLSGPAIEALNRGVKMAGCMHNTGEGGVSPYHKHGGELIWQIGTGYFGCRKPDGTFDREKFLGVVANNPVRAIELKLSQGAKPGLGGLLPAAKVTRLVAEVRGIPMGQDCASPNSHSAFSSTDEMLDFIEDIAESTGLPVGIKAAIGQLGFWQELASLMESGTRGVDYIAIDGGEGGTGAAPLAFSDHVALPFKVGMSQVFRIFAQAGLQHRIVFVGAGKLGFPNEAMTAFGLGCDMVHVAREAMLAIGCIQAQRCHTGHCPAGIATQNRWLMRGLDPTLKSARLANYVVTMRSEILKLTHACGLEHPAFITGEHLEFLDDQYGTRSLDSVFGYQPEWSLPSENDLRDVLQLMRANR
jgi:glutamate synthase (ferredoxin)